MNVESLLEDKRFLTQRGRVEHQAGLAGTARRRNTKRMLHQIDKPLDYTIVTLMVSGVVFAATLLIVGSGL